MNDDNSNDSPTLPSHIAYSVEKGSDDKNYWHRIGAAWPTHDGGLSLKLSALPVDGRINLQLRDEVQRMKAMRETTNEQFQQQHKIEPKL